MVFMKGDRVRIKRGLFVGQLGVVAEALHLADFDDPWSLTIETRAFDGSKVFVCLSGSDVEVIELPAQ